MKLHKERTFLAIAFGLFWVLAWAVYFKPKPIESFKSLEALFWHEKVHGETLYDLIIIGDSRTYRGIDPTTLKKRIAHLRIFNFGFSSGKIDRVLLEAAYKKLDPKGAKVFLLPLTTFSLLAGDNEHYLSILKKKHEVSFLQKRFPGMHIRFKPIHERRQQRKLPPVELSNYQENYCKKSGWVGSWTLKNDYDYALRSYREGFSKRSGRQSDLDLFDQNLQWCRSRGITIIAFRIPSSKDMQALEDTIGGIDFKVVREIAKNNGALWLEIPNHLPLQSYDSSHLDMPSAITLSHHIGQEIHPVLKQSPLTTQ